jgi:integrase
MLPIYETTFWTVASLLTKGNAYNTMAAKLRVVGHWLTFCERAGIVWADRVNSGKFLSPGENGEVHRWMSLPIAFQGPKPNPMLRIAPHVHASRMAFLQQYLSWEADRTIYRMEGPAHDRADRHFEAWKRQWDTIGSGGSKRGEASPSKLGLTESQRELFKRIITPGSPENPFEPGMQVRNFAILMMLFEHGLRMSEVLMLRTDDVSFSERVFEIAERLNDPHETRRVAPSPKRRGNARRSLEFTPTSMGAMESWLFEDRRDTKRFPDARKCPFVFVSERGNPLSVRRLASIFETIRNAYPERRDGHQIIQVGFAGDFSAHDLRHDWNVRFVLSRIGSWTAQDDLTQRYCMGWSRSSKMPARYARLAYRVMGGKASLAISSELIAKAKTRHFKDQEGEP